MVFCRLTFPLTTRHSPNHLTFLLVTISSSVSYFTTCYATLVCISTLGYAVYSAPATVLGGNCFRMPESASPDHRYDRCTEVSVHDVYLGTARRTTRSTVGGVDQHPSKRRVLEPTRPRRADPLPTIVRPLTHSGPARSWDTQTAPQVGKSTSWHYLVGLGPDVVFEEKKSVVIGAYCYCIR